MSQQVEAGVPVNLTGTAAVSLSPGTLLGFYVNSTTGGTIVIRDGGASGTVLSGTITPAAGIYHRFPAYCVTSCHFTIANTLNVTAFFAGG